MPVPISPPRESDRQLAQLALGIEPALGTRPAPIVQGQARTTNGCGALPFDSAPRKSNADGPLEPRRSG